MFGIFLINNLCIIIIYVDKYFQKVWHSQCSDLKKSLWIYSFLCNFTFIQNYLINLIILIFTLKESEAVIFVSLNKCFFSQVLRQIILKVNTLHLKVLCKNEMVKEEHFFNCLCIFNQSYLFKRHSGDKCKRLLKFIKRFSIKQ